MASHTSLRQASRIIQSNKSYLTTSRLRQSAQTTLLSTRTTSFSRRPLLNSHHVTQQSRNLSWWGSSSSTSTNTPTSETTSSSNINITEPSDLRNIISPDRSFKASPDVSSAEIHSGTSSTPNPIEPQIFEDIQQAIAEPHLSDPVDLPPHPEDIPEYVGYLKQVCGLDFGWGPTSTVQFVLEHLHITGGFSWTTSIILLGIAVRAMVFPFLIGAAKETQKMRDMKDIITPIQAEYTAAQAKQDRQKMAVAAQRLIAIRKEFNSNPLKAFLPPLVQIPFGFGCWRLLRNAAEHPVPGFVTESWLWTSDLTFSDPFYIAPFISGALIFLTLRINSRVNANPSMERFQNFLRWFLPIISIVFVSFQPGAVQLYFVASSVVGLVSAFVLQQGRIRRYFDMPALNPISSPTPVPSASTSIGTPSTTVAGGLHRRSLAERAAEAKAAEEAAARKAEYEKKVSGLDRSVNKFKQVGGSVGDTVKKGWATKFGMASAIESSAEKSVEKQRTQKAEEYEARMREMLNEKRRLRNQKMGGRS